jgi:hypothetical protein
LFYARPTNPRNMLGIGVDALRAAAAHPAFAGREWEFLAIGSRGSLPPLDIAPGRRLLPAPWADYRGYAAQLREADILLCPMLSPHTSYPVLEMAAAGGLAVTNSFATKTAAALRAISDNIVAAPPTREGFEAALIEAAERVAAGRDRSAVLNLPADWGAALDGTAARMAEAFRAETRVATSGGAGG